MYKFFSKKFRGSFVIVPLFAAFYIAFSSQVYAQDFETISGTIFKSNSSGVLGGVPGIEVVATLVDTGAHITSVTTDSHGRYILNVPKNIRVQVSPNNQPCTPWAPSNHVTTTSGPTINADFYSSSAACGGSFAVRGAIIDSTGSSLQNIRVVISGTQNGVRVTNIIGEFSGVFNFLDKIKFTPTDGGYGFKSQLEEIIVRSATDLQFIGEFSVVKVNVTSLINGAKLAGARVVLKSGINEMNVFTTDADGNILFPRAPGTSFSLEVSNANCTMQSINSTSGSAGSVSSIDVKLDGASCGVPTSAISTSSNTVNCISVSTSGTKQAILVNSNKLHSDTRKAVRNVKRSAARSKSTRAKRDTLFAKNATKNIRSLNGSTINALIRIPSDLTQCSRPTGSTTLTCSANGTGDQTVLIGDNLNKLNQIRRAALNRLARYKKKGGNRKTSSNSTKALSDAIAAIARIPADTIECK